MATIKQVVAIAVSTAILGVGGTVALKENATEAQVNTQVRGVIDSMQREGLVILAPPDDSIDAIKKYTDKISELDTTIYKIRDTLGHIIRRDTVINQPHWIIKGADKNDLKLNGMAGICPVGSKALITFSIGGETVDIIRIKPTLDSATINITTVVTQH